jgi:molybdenum cofactor biosynthesis enzyme MoaA
MRKCQLPYSGYCITGDGRGAPCCSMSPFGDRHVSIKDAFNLPIFQEARDNENKWPEICRTCKRQEELYGGSHASKIDLIDPVDNVISYLDISFGNTCNLNCVMCSNDYSTRWNTLNENMSDEMFNYISHNHTELKRKHIHQISYEEIDEILDHAKQLKQIVIKGGEPLWDKKSLYFLNKLKEINPNVMLKIISNITHIDIDLLTSFENMKVICSIDGIYDVYEWIRGHPFKPVYENFKKLMSVKSSNFSVGLNYTVSAYNLECLKDSFEFFSDLGLHWMEFGITVAMERHTHFRCIGKERFTRAMNEISKLNETNFDYNLTWDRDPTDEEKEMFSKFTSFMNNYRNVSCPI